MLVAALVPEREYIVILKATDSALTGSSLRLILHNCAPPTAAARALGAGTDSHGRTDHPNIWLTDHGLTIG